jgi:hypothetical protein
VSSSTIFNNIKNNITTEHLELIDTDSTSSNSIQNNTNSNLGKRKANADENFTLMSETNKKKSENDNN